MLFKKHLNHGNIAVKSNMRSSNIGTGLVNSALEWFSKNSVKIVSVVTQGRNILSQQLYQKCGFRRKRVKKIKD